MMAEHNHRSLVAADLARIVSRIIRAREKRASFFSPNLFADPAWDIILALFLALLRQKRLAVADLSNATSIPLTTAHRWIDTLEQKGWVRRIPDQLDHRRVFIELSGRGSSAMHSWINDWIEGQQSQIPDSRVRDLLSRIERGGWTAERPD